MKSCGRLAWWTRFLLLLFMCCFTGIAKPVSAENKYVNGTMNKFVRGGLVIDKDGKEVPIRVGPKTTVNINAKGDLGFLAVGRVVEVKGPPDKNNVMKDVVLTVHLSPNQTARPTTLQRTVGPTIPVGTQARAFNGVVTSMDPLTVKTIDRFKILHIDPHGRAVGETFIKAGNFVRIELKNPKAKTIQLRLGYNSKLVVPGDRVLAYFTQTTGEIARRVTVTVQKQLSSKDK